MFSIRLAIDIGSNKTKFRIGKIDFSGKKPLIYTLYEKNFPIAFQEDLLSSLDGNLSGKIQEHALKIFETIRLTAQAYSPEISLGVATEAFRKAANGQSFISRVEQVTDVPIEIISTEKEGVLSLLAAAHEVDQESSRIVCWDGGAGSLQISTKSNEKYIVHSIPLGKSQMLRILLQVQGKKDGSPNPVSGEDVEKAVLLASKILDLVPLDIRTKLREPGVRVIKKGGHPLGGEPLDFTLRDIEQALERCIGLTDEMLEQVALNMQNEHLREIPLFILSNLILNYSVMKHLEIGHVKYSGSAGGNTTGILLWPDFKNE